MKLAGKVWDTLEEHERLYLLRHCNTISHESIKKHESTLKWKQLMPVTQRDLLGIDFSGVLGREVQPV